MNRSDLRRQIKYPKKVGPHIHKIPKTYNDHKTIKNDYSIIQSLIITFNTFIMKFKRTLKKIMKFNNKCEKAYFIIDMIGILLFTAIISINLDRLFTQALSISKPLTIIGYFSELWPTLAWILFGVMVLIVTFKFTKKL